MKYDIFDEAHKVFSYDSLTKARRTCELFKDRTMYIFNNDKIVDTYVKGKSLNKLKEKCKDSFIERKD